MNLTIPQRARWHLRQLRKRGHWARGQLIRYRDEQLQQLRSYAYIYSPFYQSFHQGLFDAPLAQLPVLTKTRLMQHVDQVVTPRLKLSEKKSSRKPRGNSPFEVSCHPGEHGSSRPLCF